LPHERAWLDTLVNSGWSDTLRLVSHEPDQYTWWSYRAGAKSKNKGWRLDYFFVTESLSALVKKEDTILCNFGYQAMVSAIDALVDRRDVIVYDAESHACILDGVRLHMGKRFVFKHNDIEDCEKQLERAKKLAETTGGGILVITEGVFGMRGDQGKLKEIVALKKKYDFRLFVDDAHGIGTMGPNGGGTGEEQGCQDGIDIYFGTFAKSFALIGGFISSTKQVVTYLRYNMRSQIFAKSLPMPLVVGLLKRLELINKKINVTVIHPGLLRLLYWPNKRHL